LPKITIGGCAITNMTLSRSLTKSRLQKYQDEISARNQKAEIRKFQRFSLFFCIHPFAFILEPFLVLASSFGQMLT